MVRRRLAFMDDHPGVRDALALALRSMASVELVAALGSPSELDALVEAAPELVLIDLNLGGVRGVQVARALQARLPQVTIWLMSASSLGAPELPFPLVEKGQLFSALERWLSEP